MSVSSAYRGGLGIRASPLIIYIFCHLEWFPYVIYENYFVAVLGVFFVFF